MLAPREASVRAMACPTRLAEPVTTATLFFNSMSASFESRIFGSGHAETIFALAAGTAFAAGGTAFARTAPGEFERDIQFQPRPHHRLLVGPDEGKKETQ